MPYVVPSWLRDHVQVPPDASAEQIAADLVRVGLEEEQILQATITGPVVVGRVLEVTAKTQKNGKTINWCRVDVGGHNPADAQSRGIVCGAHNFGPGDAVVVALPGAVLPGGFEISARKTYGHISDGMIASAAELQLGEDHSGILVLDEPGPAPGSDALALLGLAEEVLEINVTPDRGYCFSMRGVAREYAHATGAAFTDHGLAPAHLPAGGQEGFAVQIEDTAPIHGQVGCDRFVTRTVRGVDADAPSPQWLSRRLRQAGMRPISLVVDITNYVMLDLGQPIHAYDLDTLAAPIVVRRARAGEKLTTLDDIQRTLDGQDLLITDSPQGSGSRLLGLAGVMGGAETEVSAATTDVLIEAAHFDQISVARTARRHKLPSEAAKRFERGVDPRLAPVAAQRVVDLLIEYAGGTVDEAVTDVDQTTTPAAIELPTTLPTRLVGVQYSTEQITATLTELGADVNQGPADTLIVTPPSWRPDLTQPADLVEEVVRLRGYHEVPSELPAAPPGRGLTISQRRRRGVLQMLADTGFVEVLTYPFIAASRHDDLGLAEDDERRLALRLTNPLAETHPYLRTSLLHTLLEAAVRNVGRGMSDLAIVETGLVTLPGADRRHSPLPPLGQVPDAGDLAAIEAAVPHQPRHVAGVLAGQLIPPGPHSPARPVDYADAIEAVQHIAQVLGLGVHLEAATDHAPWHPGRCARLCTADGAVVGYAGELAPKVLTTLGLPARTVAFEVDLDAMLTAAPHEPVQIAQLATYPPVKEDIALVVGEDVAAAQVLATVREAGGPLLEQVHLFDRYHGEAIGVGKVSLAFALRFRAPDRTLTAAETAEIREQMVALAAQRFGAELRS